VSFSEYVGTDSTEFKKFYGIVNQRSISKTSSERNMTVVCLDYISILQFMDINISLDGTKVEVENEVLTPVYLPYPNDSLAQLFNFANDSLAQKPAPLIMIRNKDTDAEDPQYDGFEIYHENGQLKLGYPLNAKYNYDLVATSYYFYTQGLYAEDILEQILIQADGYGGYLFNEPTAQAVIDNHLTTTFSSVEGRIIDTLTPNLSLTTTTISTTLTVACSSGDTTIQLEDNSGFPTSGEANINGDTFTWTSKGANSLEGIPSSGTYSLGNHPIGSKVSYTMTYGSGHVWYLTYSNVQTDLDSGDFTIPGGAFSYFDKREGRIILVNAINTTSVVTCNSDYTFKTLQASGIELNSIKFNSREVSSRFDAIKKLQEYLAPNYVIRTIGDDKIWSGYLSQRYTEDYTLQLVSNLNYLEDEDLYTRVVLYGKNKNPSNLMFSDGINFVTTGKEYKAIASDSTLSGIREEGNYYVYGSALSGVGRIIANLLKPIVYLNAVPIDNSSHIIAGQQVTVEVTTRTETTTSGGGK
jgi:hypothetical protein